MTSTPTQTLDVVVYGGPRPRSRRELPGEAVDDGARSFAEQIVARTLEARDDIPPCRIVAPQRVRSVVATPATLRIDAVLERLLVWPTRAAQPDLVVTIVDVGEGRRTSTRDRLGSIDAELSRRLPGAPPRVLAIATPEVSVWALADTHLLREMFGASVDAVGNPETLEPGAATARLKSLAGSNEVSSLEALQGEIAQSIDLDVLSRRVRAYRNLKRELEAVRLD